MNSMIEIRFHGRGGQGAVTAAELVAVAAINEGRYAQAFPSFGPERRGALVAAFARINDERIRVRYPVEAPDVLIVIDPGLLFMPEVWKGLKPDTTVVANTPKSVSQLRKETVAKQRLATVDATGIAKEILGLPIPNTTMLGAIVKATELVKLESLERAIEHRFGRLADKNIAAMRVAYERTEVGERVS
ncbi:Pyruvate synthase subunit PorC [subsurface metagenome]